FVGYYVVWSVTPALHTPLMSVTNAISSVIVVGALLAVGVQLIGSEGGPIIARVLGFVALVVGAVNIAGGSLATQLILAMYKKKKKCCPPECRFGRIALSRRRRSFHFGAARPVEPGNEPPRKFVRHGRHGHRHPDDAPPPSARRL